MLSAARQSENSGHLNGEAWTPLTVLQRRSGADPCPSLWFEHRQGRRPMCGFAWFLPSPRLTIRAENWITCLNNAWWQMGVVGGEPRRGKRVPSGGGCGGSRPRTDGEDVEVVLRRIGGGGGSHRAVAAGLLRGGGAGRELANGCTRACGEGEERAGEAQASDGEAHEWVGAARTVCAKGRRGGAMCQGRAAGVQEERVVICCARSVGLHARHPTSGTGHLGDSWRRWRTSINRDQIQFETSMENVNLSFDPPPDRLNRMLYARLVFFSNCPSRPPDRPTYASTQVGRRFHARPRREGRDAPPGRPRGRHLRLVLFLRALLECAPRPHTPLLPKFVSLHENTTSTTPLTECRGQAVRERDASACVRRRTAFTLDPEGGSGQGGSPALPHTRAASVPHSLSLSFSLTPPSLPSLLPPSPAGLRNEAEAAGGGDGAVPRRAPERVVVHGQGRHRAQEAAGARHAGGGAAALLTRRAAGAPGDQRREARVHRAPRRRGLSSSSSSSSSSRTVPFSPQRPLDSSHLHTSTRGRVRREGPWVTVGWRRGYCAATGSTS